MKTKIKKDEATDDLTILLGDVYLPFFISSHLPLSAQTHISAHLLLDVFPCLFCG